MDTVLLNEYISFDVETGVAHWIKRPTNRVLLGAKVGTVDKGGYTCFTLKGKQYKLHRVLYFLAHGYLPDCIDHINGNPADNRKVNLRAADFTQNNRNMRKQKNNTSGVTGVSWSAHKNKWVAVIWHQSKCIVLGAYPEIKDAIHVRKTAERKYGYHPNHGR